jgi:hypothetical protein
VPPAQNILHAEETPQTARSADHDNTPPVAVKFPIRYRTTPEIQHGLRSGRVMWFLR